ncbi:MAG: alpha/beta hydrolase [bacterium]|nr:alpha/beta hydrolase [bacterium]
MFIEVGDIRCYYERAGEGTPLLLLHGWGGNSGSMRPILNLLKDRFSVINIDLPGFGRTNLPASFSIEDYALFTKDLLSALGIDRVDLVTHSFGGRIAIFLATNYPELINRLVLVNAAGIRRRPPLYWIKLLLVKTLGKIESLKPKIYELIGSKDWKEAGILRQTLVKVVNHNLKPLLSKINQPTLLIWGENDRDVPISSARIMNKEIIGSELVILKDAGHFSYLDRFPEFSRHLLAFL